MMRVIDFVARHSRVFRQATFRYWLILPLAAAGLLSGVGESRRFFCSMPLSRIYSVVVVAFVVTARYRLPIVPILIIFAAAAINEWCEWLADRGWTAGWRRTLRIGASVILAIGVVLVARPTPSSPATRMRRLSLARPRPIASRGISAAAATWYENALADYPEYCDAAHNLGRIHAEVFADPEQAVEILRACDSGVCRRPRGPATPGSRPVRRRPMWRGNCPPSLRGRTGAGFRRGARSDLERARRIVGTGLISVERPANPEIARCNCVSFLYLR